VETHAVYMPRIVLDANCINAKGRISEMTRLEEYHDAGVLEILKTSTLPVELATAPVQAEKAKKYGVIGECMFFIQGNQTAQSMPGAGVRPSRMPDLMDRIFGTKLDGHARIRALRDVLHLDQAHQNDADVFVTNDRRLLEASALLEQLGIEVKVQTPAECLAKIVGDFEKNHGTSAVQRLREEVQTHGPIVLGSNSCFGLSLSERRYGESLIELRIAEGHLLITAKLRGANGQMLLELSPDASPMFHDRNTSLRAVGKGPLRCSETPYYQFVVWHCEEPLIAARATHSGRVIFNRMTLRDKDGHVSVQVNRQALALQDAWFGP
jgi:hypothetical protein